jgi:hypothetical protein
MINEKAGRRKHKTAVKPRKITKGLLHHIKNSGLYPEGNRLPWTASNRKRDGLPTLHLLCWAAVPPMRGHQYPA